MVAHIVPLIGQKKPMGCWAAAFAMMDSWKSKASIPIAATLQKLGPTYVSAYSGDAGLSSAHVGAAIATLGLRKEPPLNPTADRWRQLLSDSPLFVVVDEDPYPNLFAVHARVIFEIKADAGSTVVFNDSGANNLNGAIRSQPLARFVHDYEQLAGGTWAGMQIIHW